MDRETLRYLADIAVVRGHLSNILNVGRGAINQKTLHQVSAKATVLDKLFVDTILSGRSPGSSGQSIVQENNDDFVDIAARLQQEKAKIAAKQQPQQPQQPQQQQQLNQMASIASPPELIPEPVVEDPGGFDDEVFQPPADEVAAFEALLAQAESETTETTEETTEETEEEVVEAAPKKVRKKGVRKKAAKK